MKASEFDGQYILYRDMAKMTHAGFVVGQSEDSTKLYVQADFDVLGIRPDDRPWHWTLTRDLLPSARLIPLGNA